MTEYLQGPFTDSVFTDTITFAEPTGRNNAGDPIVGIRKAVKARVERKMEILVDADGVTIMSNHKIATMVEIPIGSCIWLGEDTTDATALRPITVESAKAPSGMVLYEIKL